MSFLTPKAPTIAQPQLPETPPPVLAPQGSKPGAKNQRTTFLGGGDIANPAPTSGGQVGKTLLGM